MQMVDCDSRTENRSTGRAYRTIKRRQCLLLLSVFALGLSVSLDSCKEPLPSYREPEQLFSGRIEGEYWLSDTEHSFRIYIYVTNIFDETLEGPASLKGSIELFFGRDPRIRKTFTLNSQNLISPRSYYPATGSLRIDPKQTLVFQAIWYFPANQVIDDSGRNLTGDTTTASFFSYVDDKTCKWRKLARPEDLVLEGNVNLFEKSAPVLVGPKVFPLCFVTNFVDVRICPRIITIPPYENYWPGNADL